MQNLILTYNVFMQNLFTKDTTKGYNRDKFFQKNRPKNWYYFGTKNTSQNEEYLIFKEKCTKCTFLMVFL